MSLFKGCGTALATPFKNNSTEVDFDAFRGLIEFQLGNNISSLIVLGTTGEASTISLQEKIEIVKFAVDCVKNRAPVIVGAGSNDTRTTIENCREFEKLGIDGLLIVTPYYNKCTQNGLYEHYKSIAEKTSLPIILYNVPGRTGVNILPKTVMKLSLINNIVAIKEASGNIEQISEMIRLCGDYIDIYSGDDGIVLPVLSMGGSGVISVVSNIIPKEMSLLCSSFFSGNIDLSRKLQLKINPLVKAVFSEVNPIPIKTALSIMNICTSDLRLPLTEMEEDNKENLILEMKKFNLLDE